ncbi:MAG: TraB/GumN family protein [Steroidobacteraceae bacterium]
MPLARIIPFALLTAWLTLAWIATAVAAPAATATQNSPLPAPAAAVQAPMEEVVITGEHEGPRLWKVRKGDHVLWILGTVTPLPKKMIWQSDSVEAVLQQSQEVVPAWPAFGIGANPFTALRVWIQWRRIQKIPDRMNLREVLPPALYARFSALKARYAPKDERLDELRPGFAAERLLDEALDATGLTMHNEVQQSVLKLARKQGVKIHQDKLKVEHPVDVLKDVGATPLSGEVACLEAVIGRLETDLGPMQARARAWALGDVDMLRKLNHPDDRTACIAAVAASDRVRDLIARAQEDWFLSAEDALARNRSTLAVQSMDRLLGDNGTLAILRKEGYQVEGP